MGQISSRRRRDQVVALYLDRAATRRRMARLPLRGTVNVLASRGSSGEAGSLMAMRTRETSGPRTSGSPRTAVAALGVLAKSPWE
jgi:hypothetical protein